jgi:DTW domain-containing protein
MRSRAAPGDGGRCARCALRPPCACDLLAPLPVRTRFVIVRHVRETDKSSNSARWASLLLPRCELRTWAGRCDALTHMDVGRPGDCLLFPDGGAVPQSRGPPALPERVVVLDGTWRQVRRMLRALPALQRLPRLSLGPRAPRPRVRLRAAPAPGYVSTLEAIAGAVAILEGDALGQALEARHRAVVARARAARGWRLSEAA